MKSIILILLTLSIAYAESKYSGDTLAPVILAGSVVKHKGTEIIKKYPRSKCPVCKGTGKYLSGDKISLVDCGYCEPEAKTPDQTNITCDNKDCECKACKCKNCGCVPSVREKVSK